MNRERRNNTKLAVDDVKEFLSNKQVTALLECQYFGWKLKFIRRPLFQDPIPVLYNSGLDKIGVLEMDGRVNVDIDLDIRSDENVDKRIKSQKNPENSKEHLSWEEKRKHTPPIPNNLGELLNQRQMHTLRHIESLGWKLRFVRRPLFQDPVPVILSPTRDKYAVLDQDGLLNMTPDLNIRKEELAEHEVAAELMLA
jgi:hypothetical protein